jgi:NAD(P)-dependent dehydrogenase (short-subunit alcohol dehydrogenase family)
MNLDRPFDFTGKAAVITGGGGVLCSVLARALAQCGASVALLDINLPAAEEATAEIRISSMAAFRPLTRTVAYSPAKAAVSNFTQWLAVHISQNYSDRIRVNAIAPGFFLTEQNRFLLVDEHTGELTERGQAIIDHTPTGHFGDPEDLVGAVLWLLSDGASFVHGAVIPIDGGFSAFSGV